MPYPATLRALALPLRPSPLMLVAACAALLAFGVRAGLYGLPIVLIVGSWFLKYGFLVLDHAAEGRPGAPVLAVEHMNPLGEARPLLYGLVLLVAWSVTGQLETVLGDRAVVAARLAGLLALPAILATHTVQGSLAQALNPRTFATMAWRLGPGYLLVLCLATACGWLAHAMARRVDSFGLLASLALLMFLWLALFATLGGVLHDRRLEVGFDPEHSPERQRDRAAGERDRGRDRLMDRAFAEYRAGRRAGAMNTLREHAMASADPADEYEWILERVGLWPDARLARDVAQELMSQFLLARRTGDALRICRRMLQADATFRPSSGEETLQLAVLARAAGDRTTARALLDGFDARHADAALRIRAQRLAEEIGSRQARDLSRGSSR